MTPETLLTFTGDVLICVKAKNEYDIKDLVHIKKIAAGLIPYNADYDFNDDGAVDDTDVAAVRNSVLGGE